MLLRHKNKAQHQPQPRQPNRNPQRPTIPEQRIRRRFTAIVNLSLRSPRKTQPQRDAIINDSHDDARANPLVLRRHSVGEDDSGRGERRVHADADDEDTEEEEGPVVGVHGHGGGEDRPDDVRELADDHDPRGGDLTDGLTDGERGDEAGWDHGAVPCCE